MSKKIIAILMAVTLSAAVLTSCGGEEVTSSKAAGASSVTTADVSSTEGTASTESTASTASTGSSVSTQSTVSNVSSGKGVSSNPGNKPASSTITSSNVTPKPDPTPDLTLDQIPDLFPDLTLDQILDLFPDLTPDQILDLFSGLTPDQIPDLFPDLTPDQIPDPTPDPSRYTCEIVNLDGQFNKKSFSNKDRTNNADFDGNKDGQGSSSYAAELIPSVNITVRNPYIGNNGLDVKYKLGNINGNAKDTIHSNGQTVTLPNKKAEYICLLGASGMYAAVMGYEDHEYKVNYTDGTSEMVLVSMQNWCAAPELYSGPQAYRAKLYKGKWITENHKTYLGAYEIMVDPDKTLKSITLPSGATHNIFAITLVY